jgi:hypothetical protein
MAGPVHIPRVVDQLDQAAFEEAHQRDDTATRAFSNVRIKTSDGRCLFSDPLAGDFRANLAPIFLGECGSTDGEGWDVITAGEHNDQPGNALFVSTLTQACINADPRRERGDQIILFSCGGRADGGGEVTDSQLFAFDGSQGPITLTPGNGEGFCLTLHNDFIDIDNCRDNDPDQQFFLCGDAGGNDGSDGGNGNDGNAGVTSSPSETGDGSNDTPAPSTAAPEPTSSAPSDDSPATTAAPDGSIPTANPTTPVPVSGARGELDPSAAAEAHQFDDTAERALQDVHIRVPGGANECLSVDPTGGDFRQNLIPVAVQPCADVPNQKFDVVTKGVHNNNDLPGALIVSSLTEGCISFDPRRQEGDTVNIFSCGGRADGGELPFPSSMVFSDVILLTLVPHRWQDG